MGAPRGTDGPYTRCVKGQRHGASKGGKGRAQVLQDTEHQPDRAACLDTQKEQTPDQHISDSVSRADADPFRLPTLQWLAFSGGGCGPGGKHADLERGVGASAAET